MALSIDTQDTGRRIHELVQGGFDKLADIRWIITDEYLDEETLTSDDVAWIEQAIAIATEEKLSAQAAWAKPTTYDRLEEVFEKLRLEKYIALHCAGNSNSDGRSDAREAWQAAGGPGSGILGYCFYHSQDVERVVHTGNLYLAFSGVGSTRDEQIARSRVLADRLRALLEEQGFSVAWDGDLEKRIEVRIGPWQKRSI